MINALNRQQPLVVLSTNVTYVIEDNYNKLTFYFEGISVIVTTSHELFRKFSYIEMFIFTTVYRFRLKIS